MCAPAWHPPVRRAGAARLPPARRCGGIDIAPRRHSCPTSRRPPLARTLTCDDPAAARVAAGVRALGSGAYGVVVAAEMTVRRVVAGAALECRLPCAVKTLWHAIAGPFHVAAFMREVRHLRDVS